MLSRRFPALLDKQNLDGCHLFCTLWYAKLTEAGATGPIAYENVRRWTTREDDLFARQFIFVPIHGNLHWSLAIICNPGSHAGPGEKDAPFILHLNSIAGPGTGSTHCTTTIGTNLRSFLRHEWASKVEESTGKFGPRDVPVMRVPGFRGLPMQNNGYDCGLFLLSYMYFFLHELPTELSPMSIMRMDGGLLESDFLTRRWFSARNASAMRSFIRMDILHEYVRQACSSYPPVLPLHVIDEITLLRPRAARFLPPGKYSHSADGEFSARCMDYHS